MEEKLKVLSFDKIKQFSNALEVDENINYSDYEVFMHNFLGANNELNKTNINNLNIDYIKRLRYILETFSLYDNNSKLLDNNDYISFINIYRIDSLIMNLKNLDTVSTKQAVPKSLMFI